MAGGSGEVQMPRATMSSLSSMGKERPFWKGGCGGCCSVEGWDSCCPARGLPPVPVTHFGRRQQFSFCKVQKHVHPQLSDTLIEPIQPKGLGLALNADPTAPKGEPFGQTPRGAPSSWLFAQQACCLSPTSLRGIIKAACALLLPNPIWLREERARKNTEF